MFGARLYCVSNTLKNKVLARHDRIRPARSGTLPNDLGVRYPRNDTRPRMPLRLACVGILEERKNPAFLLQCISMLRTDDFTLSFFGLGPAEGQLRQLTEGYGLTHKVRFEGWVDPDKIWPNVDLLMMPSQHEGAPNAILEALANEVPVLASDIPEHREILPPSALLPLHQPGKWSRTLEETIKHKAYRDRLRVIQREASKRLFFDWDRTVTAAILACDAAGDVSRK